MNIFTNARVLDVLTKVILLGTFVFLLILVVVAVIRGDWGPAVALAGVAFLVVLSEVSFRRLKLRPGRKLGKDESGESKVD